MNRHFTKLAVLVLAILLAELIHAYAHSFLHHYITKSAPYKSTALSMAVAVLVFYPAFHFIEKYFKSASEKYVEGAKKITNNRYLGLLIGFSLALLILFAAFAQIWYHKNPFVDIKFWFKGLF